MVCISQWLLIRPGHGFVVINLANRTCFSINASQHIENCRLQSAIHYLRNYSEDTIGFVFSPNDAEKHQVCTIYMARWPGAFSNNVHLHKSGMLSDQLTRLIIDKYTNVCFLARQ